MQIVEGIKELYPLHLSIDLEISKRKNIEEKMVMDIVMVVKAWMQDFNASNIFYFITQR